MMGIDVERSVFIYALLSGMILYSGYACIRKLRALIKHSSAAIILEDILFWLGMAVYLFVQIYVSCDGSIRWYFVVGVALGIVLCVIVEKILKKY